MAHVLIMVGTSGKLKKGESDMYLFTHISVMAIINRNINIGSQ